jgi:hypothetical protein
MRCDRPRKAVLFVKNHSTRTRTRMRSAEKDNRTAVSRTVMQMQDTTTRLRLVSPRLPEPRRGGCLQNINPANHKFRAHFSDSSISPGDARPICAISILLNANQRVLLAYLTGYHSHASTTNPPRSTTDESEATTSPRFPQRDVRLEALYRWPARGRQARPHLRCRLGNGLAR